MELMLYIGLSRSHSLPLSEHSFSIAHRLAMYGKAFAETDVVVLFINRRGWRLTLSSLLDMQRCNCRHGLCSCVALLHLGKMRALGWSPDYVAAAITMHRARVNPEEAFPFGDQDVFRIVHELYPGSVYKVPSSWDLMPFCGGYDVAAHEQQAGAFPGIVHFTCTNKAQIYSSLESFGRWGWLVQYYQAMQWEWLNEGRLEQRMHATAPMEIK